VKDDFNPAINLPLVKDTSASVSGRVLDGQGGGVEGARVSVTGYENEGVITPVGGKFVLPAHAAYAYGKDILLHVEKAGFKPVDQWGRAGDAENPIVVEKQ
jgi:hypothetical protein